MWHPNIQNKCFCNIHGNSTNKNWLDLIYHHHRRIGPHNNATNVCLVQMLQPLPRLIPFFGGPSLPHFSSSSLACQVFWIPQLPSAALASECVLHSRDMTKPSHPSFFCRREKIWSIQDRPGLKPACCWRNSWSIVYCKWFSNTLANTLPGTDKSIIPRQLLQSVRSPFFGSGMMTPLLQSTGTASCCHTKLHTLSGERL